jgi:hypothetical protein
MKSIWLTLILSVCVLSSVFAQKKDILIDNNKIKVTQYTTLPGENICGVGMHTHAEHVNVLMTDAKVKSTYPDGSTDMQIYDVEKHQLTIISKGKQQVISSYGGFVAPAGAHELKNIGTKPFIYYMIETK